MSRSQINYQVLKQELFELCTQKVQERIDHAQVALQEAREAGNDEVKSSVGDKHETSRAMTQLDQERAAGQLREAEKLQSLLGKIKIDQSLKQVGLGSLVETSNGTFFIAIGLGKLELTGKDYLVISPASPMGTTLLGKLEGASVRFNGKDIQIEKLV